MSDTPVTPTTMPQPNYTTTTVAGALGQKVAGIVGAPATGETTEDIPSPGVPKGAVPESGRPPKEVVQVVTDSTGKKTSVTSYVFYDPQNDANLILSTMTPARRDQVQQILYERGQYGGSKRGNGLNTQDISAFADLLYYANAKGKPWEQALDAYTKDFATRTDLVPGTGRRAPVQVTNSDDIKTVFKKTAQSLLGRDVDDKIADAFAASIQAQQVAQQRQFDTQSGGMVEQPADIATMAEQKIENQFGQELRVQNAANAANIIDNLVKGLAR